MPLPLTVCLGDRNHGGNASFFLDWSSARGQTGRAIKVLLGLAPKTARSLREDDTASV